MVAKIKFEIRPYRRSFAVPLQTARETWIVRHGIVVRLEAVKGAVGYGEIAPLESFVTESMATAWAFLKNLGKWIDERTGEQIPTTLPCCRYALASAQEDLAVAIPSRVRAQPLEVAGLLTLDKAASAQASAYLAAGYQTLKCKIGLRAAHTEIESFKRLVSLLPNDVHWRLDANGALDLPSTRRWLDFLDLSEAKVEYLEQPLPPSQPTTLQAFAHDFETPLALDESIASYDAIRRWGDAHWPGVLVIKPSLIGSLSAFRQWRKQCPCPLVYSSAFETAIGIEAGLRLAASDPCNRRALGFGTLNCFGNDPLSWHRPGPILSPYLLKKEDLEQIWQTLKP